MSWSNFSVIGDPLADAQRLVQRVVRDRRAAGDKIGDAIQQAALALDTTPRRARSLLYGEVFAVARGEYQKLLDRFLAYLDAGADELEKQAEQRRVLRRQLSLLGDLECGSKSVSSDARAGGDSANGLNESRADRAEKRYRELRAEIGRERMGRGLRG